MDQMASACGESNKLLAMVFQPAEVRGLVSIPSHIRFWCIGLGMGHRDVSCNACIDAAALDSISFTKSASNVKANTDYVSPVSVGLFSSHIPRNKT
ncbi:hypothetical protein C5167_041684 [Papaver somniferum]|nr:hypothetical protein C5167_041684 [Papaver somniferum]